MRKNIKKYYFLYSLTKPKHNLYLPPEQRTDLNQQGCKRHQESSILTQVWSQLQNQGLKAKKSYFHQKFEIFDGWSFKCLPNTFAQSSRVHHTNEASWKVSPSKSKKLCIFFLQIGKNLNAFLVCSMFSFQNGSFFVARKCRVTFPELNQFQTLEILSTL